MAVQLIEREAFRIIGLTLETMLHETREQMIIPKLQHTFHARIAEIDGAIGLPTTYGLFIDPPNWNPETEPFRWIAGVEVGGDVVPPADMVTYELPKATYAVLAYQGSIAEAGSAYDQLYRWISNSEYELAGLVGFELYTTNESAVERGTADFLLHLPVRRR